MDRMAWREQSPEHRQLAALDLVSSCTRRSDRVEKGRQQLKWATSLTPALDQLPLPATLIDLRHPERSIPLWHLKGRQSPIGFHRICNSETLAHAN